MYIGRLAFYGPQGFSQRVETATNECIKEPLERANNYILGCRVQT